MKYLLELRTTISPTPSFFRRIHFLAASLRDLGGALADHEIVVSVGGGQPENYYRTQPWSNRYPLIWRPVDPEAYARLGYRATNRDRAAHLARGTFVMVVDADVIFLNDFSPLIDDLRADPAIVGVMAHTSPFINPPDLTPDFAHRAAVAATDEDLWQMLAQHHGAPLPALDQVYSGWGATAKDPAHRLAPAYFNGGMVLGPAAMMEAMFAGYAAAESAVDAVMTSYFRPQIARTLSCLKAGLPCRSLPLRYNFPNDPLFERLAPAEAEAASILHYLRTAVVHRDDDFRDRESVERLVARRDLSGSNERLRQRIAELSETVLSEERA